MPTINLLMIFQFLIFQKYIKYFPTVVCCEFLVVDSISFIALFFTGHWMYFGYCNDTLVQ